MDYNKLIIFSLCIFCILPSITHATDYDYSRNSTTTIYANLSFDSTGTKQFTILNTSTYAENPDDVFLIFDDFNDASLDTDKWDVVSGTGYSLSDGYLQMASGTTETYLRSKKTAPIGSIFEASSYSSALKSLNTFVGAKNSDGTDELLVYAHEYSNNYIYLFSQNNGTYTQDSATSFGTVTTEYIYKILWYSGHAISYQGDTQMYSYTTNVPDGDSELSMSFRAVSDTAGKTMYSDWARARPYYATMPTISCTDNLCNVTVTATGNYVIPLTTTYTTGNLNISDSEAAPSENMTFTIKEFTPSTIYQNATGNVSLTIEINSSVGVNESRCALFRSNYDTSNSEYLKNIREPSNTKAESLFDFGNIFRADNRNQSSWFESLTETNSNIWQYAITDETNVRMSMTPSGTNATMQFNGLIQDSVFPSSWYIDRTEQEDATKTFINIYQNNPAIIEKTNIFNLPNMSLSFFAYTNYSNSPTKNLLAYYCNSSYDPTASIRPQDSSNCVFYGGYTPTDTRNYLYEPRNSSYIQINLDVVDYQIAGIDVTNTSYFAFSSATSLLKSYKIATVNTTTSTNISFSETETLRTSINDGTDWTILNRTADVWTSAIDGNTQLKYFMVCYDTDGTKYVQDVQTKNIINSFAPPTAAEVSHINGDYSWNTSEVEGTISIGILASQDPDGGTVTHNLSLLNSDGSFNQTINSSFTGNGEINISFDTAAINEGNYRLLINATDDEGESTVTNTTDYFTIYHNQIFYAESIDSGSSINTFSILFNNGTKSYYATTTDGVIIAKLSDMPTGTVTLTTQSSGYATNTTTISINDYSILNVTIFMDTAGLTLNIFDELTYLKIPSIITIFNSTTSQKYGIGSKFDSKSITYGAETHPTEYICDMDLSSSGRVRIDEFNSDYVYCYVPMWNNIINYSVKWNSDYVIVGRGNISVAFYNTLTDSYDTKDYYSGIAAPLDTFLVDNTENIYNGKIRFKFQSLAGSGLYGYPQVWDIYPTNYTAIDELSLTYQDVPQGVVTINIDDLEDNIYTPRNYYATLSEASKISLDAYLLKTAVGHSVNFIALSLSDAILENVLITAYKSISGTYVEVAQGKTDGSGTSQIFLSPTQSYYFTFAKTNYLTLATTITPSLSEYVVRLSDNVLINFTAMYDDISFLIQPISIALDNTTNQTFSFTIISTNSSLEYIGMNLTYNGTQIYANEVTTSPAGTIISTSVDLSDKSGNLILTAYFKKTGYNETSINITYSIWVIDPQGFTLKDLFDSANADDADAGSLFYGIAAIFITILAIATISQFSIVGGVFTGLLVLGIMSYINWFSWNLYLLVVVVSLCMGYISR